MDQEKAVRFYGSLFALLALVSAIILLPLPLILAFRIEWEWIFLYAAYPSLAITWAFIYYLMIKRLGGKKNESN